MNMPPCVVPLYCRFQEFQSAAAVDFVDVVVVDAAVVVVVVVVVVDVVDAAAVVVLVVVDAVVVDVDAAAGSLLIRGQDRTQRSLEDFFVG